MGRGASQGCLGSPRMPCPAHPSETLDGSAQLVRVAARVTLRRVEVLVSEQLVDLPQVRARTQELGFCQPLGRPPDGRGDAL